MHIIDHMSEAASRRSGVAPYVPSLLDADVAPDDVAAWAATVTPGSAVVKPLVHVNVRRLSYAGRVDALAALERQRSWIDAQQLRLLAVMANDPVEPGSIAEMDKQWVKEDVACALRLSAQTAADRLEFAKAMTRLPATLDLQERGEITVHHCRHLAETVMTWMTRLRPLWSQRCWAKAPEQVLANFKRSVRKAVLTCRAEAGGGTPRRSGEAATRGAYSGRGWHE